MSFLVQQNGGDFSKVRKFFDEFVESIKSTEILRRIRREYGEFSLSLSLSLSVFVVAFHQTHLIPVKDRETDRQRDRQTERQTDRETDRQRDRQTERRMSLSLSLSLSRSFGISRREFDVSFFQERIETPPSNYYPIIIGGEEDREISSLVDDDERKGKRRRRRREKKIRLRFCRSPWSLPSLAKKARSPTQ